MKRPITLLLILCMVITIFTPAVIAEAESVAVVYGANAGYLVYIPDAVYIGNKIGDKTYTELKITDALLESNATVIASLTGESYSRNKWHLRSGSKKLAYSIMIEIDNGKYISAADAAELCRLTSGQSITRSLCYVTEELPREAGTYQDILTFVFAYNTNQ